jgi:membrane associated rhomboid family serine protease
MRKLSFWSLTNILILINVAVFIAVFVASFFNQQIINYFSLSPQLVLQGKNIWTIFTSIFMHAGFFHLFVNMMSLFFLGNFLEMLIGGKRFIGIYLISGIAGSLAYIYLTLLFGQNMTIPAVGASGAIFGLAGILAVLTPKMKVFIFPIPIAMPMWIGVISIMALFWILSAAFNLPIGNNAHLGGFIAGLTYAFYLRLKYRHKTRMIANLFH